ncbi:hypothetical protein JTE90_022773 [Oedothorax gibbosus]|uniref:TEP1-F n=1 Tax=Oedothorax gibbosus TaxID=931172 RepID=A0AAV6U8N8_9ARAC|nr:hypothetical protein JTE90_022773 [Oedothorax gibbosus]
MCRFQVHFVTKKKRRTKMELRNSIFFLTFCCTIFAFGTSAVREGNGYIFTSPRVVAINQNNQLQMLRFGNLEAGSFKVSIFYKENYDSNETLASTTEYQLEKGKKQSIYQLYVSPFPKDYVYGGRIQIEGETGGQKFGGNDSVRFETPKNAIIVIQTDKGLYKTGQTVRIRFLCLDSDLRPSNRRNDVGEVYIEDPKGTRLFQQKGIYLGKGLAETQFLLADEPFLGTWKITLKTQNYTESTTFDVKEYQLPKYEVKIKFPPFTLATTSIVPITICANFTYGKPVQGTLNLNVSIDEPYYYYRSSQSERTYPVDQQHIKLDGCYTYNANITALQKDPANPNYYSRIKVLANVVQEGTGVQINATEYLDRTTSPLQLSFDSDNNNRNYFKPGLPYNGKVIVKNPDGTPAGEEIIELSYTVTKQRVIAGYLGTRTVQFKKNFTAESNGQIKFTIPPQNVDATSISLNAQSYKYSGNVVLNNPSAYQSLSPFYSPSGSYIQLANVEETIPCGTQKQFKLLFTSPPNSEYKFYYEVLKKGKAVQSGTKKVTFTEEDNLSYRFENDNRLINDKRETLVPSKAQEGRKHSSSSGSSSSEEDDDKCPAARESRFVPMVGEAKIAIDVDPSLSDGFSILLFYVRSDGETVADTRNFKVDKCLKNKVSFKFADQVKQPGQNTSIQIAASPNSLCGVRAIDKSVTLLNNNNQLTKDKIFQLINDMNIDDYYPDDLCNQDNPKQPGLEDKIILPPGPDSSSSSDDTYAVFQTSGLLTISNLRLFTRQCKNNDYRPPGRPVYYDSPRGGGSAEDEEYETGEYASAEYDSVEDGGVSTVSAVAVRNKFPETWLFEMELVGCLYNNAVAFALTTYKSEKLLNEPNRNVNLVARDAFISTPVYIPEPDGRAIRIAPAGPGAVSSVSAVEVRRNFPETWLFELELVGYVNVKPKSAVFYDGFATTPAFATVEDGAVQSFVIPNRKVSFVSAVASGKTSQKRGFLRWNWSAGKVSKILIPNAPRAFIAPAGPNAPGAPAPVSTESAVDVRQNFPETWLFEMELVGPSGQLSTQKTLPDTITDWIGDAVCVSSKDGLGISDTASIKGFQLFFISYTLPDNAIRGEVFTVVVSVTSYANGPLPIAVSLDDPEGFEVVSGTVNKNVCIQPGSGQNIPVKLKATTVGNVNITVRAETAKDSKVCGSSGSSQYARDAITQSLEVEAEGFPVQQIRSNLFCPLDKSTQSSDTYNLAIPNDSVNGSQRAFLDVTGNILGPSIRNIDNLVALPTGCGEQNLVKFVPNILVIDYLSAIGELDDKTKSKAIRNLNTGYQRELTYQRDDNSFSAFGNSDPSGSMFLTAFVTRSFREAQRYITIDDNVIQNAQKWIVSKQMKNGCFPDVGQIIDNGLQGGIEKDNTPTTITAYVLASLLISKFDNQTIIDKAAKCLKDNPPKTPYEIFLVAYAEALAGKKGQAQKRIDDVKPLAQTDENGAETYFNPNGTDSVDLETVAYAVITNLQLNNNLDSILGLVKDLASKLKPNGGFYSTQDTVVGLTALAGFGKLVYAKPIHLTVSVSGALNEEVQVTKDNKILVQRKQVEQVPGKLKVKTKGSGCGLIQVTLRYNSLTPPGENKYYIKVLGQCHGVNCTDRKISGTVRYLPDGKSAGFSTVTLKMVTGIVPDPNGIKQLPGQNGNKILRADVEGNSIVLYFNDINNYGENFEFPVNRVVKVDNPQPGSATVVNYYNPVVSTTTTYTFEDTKVATTTAAPTKAPSPALTTAARPKKRSNRGR